MLVGIGEESDKSRECVSEVADRGWNGEPVIIRPAKNLGMDIVGDDGGVSDVDWNHGFLYGSIKHDLSCFGVTKDVEFCIFVSEHKGRGQENVSPATAPRLPMPTPPPMKTISSTQ